MMRTMAQHTGVCVEAGIHVLVETPAIEITISNPDEVAEFNEVWNRLAADALDRDRSRDLLKQIIKAVQPSTD